MKTVLGSLAAALALTGSAAGAAPPTVDPDAAPAGSTISISGPPGPVTLEPLGGDLVPVVAAIPEGGSVSLVVPRVATGTRYRVIVPGSTEAPVFTVSEPLDGQTSVLLVGFGLALVLAFLVGGVVLHRRWRDAIS